MNWAGPIRIVKNRSFGLATSNTSIAVNSFFEAKGANLYDDASIDIKPGFENLTLEPVNMDEMLRQNQDILFLLESEAIEFIRETFIDYSVASKKFEEFKANQLDYEALAAAIEKERSEKKWQSSKKIATASILWTKILPNSKEKTSTYYKDRCFSCIILWWKRLTSHP